MLLCLREMYLLYYSHLLKHMLNRRRQRIYFLTWIMIRYEQLYLSKFEYKFQISLINGMSLQLCCTWSESMSGVAAVSPPLLGVSWFLSEPAAWHRGKQHVTSPVTQLYMIHICTLCTYMYDFKLSFCIINAESQTLPCSVCKLHSALTCPSWVMPAPAAEADRWYGRSGWFQGFDWQRPLQDHSHPARPPAHWSTAQDGWCYCSL